jgi:hypothetical protein
VLGKIKLGKVQREEDLQDPRQRQLKPRRHWLRNRRILLILPFAVTAIVLAPLHFLKKSTEVEINLKVSGVSFVIGEPSSTGFLNEIRTRSITLQSFQRIEPIPGSLEIATNYNADPPSGWLPISRQAKIRIAPRSEFASITLNNVTLSYLTIQPDSFMTLSSIQNESNSLKVDIHGAGAGGHIIAGKPLILSCNYCEVSGLPADYDFASKLLQISSEREHEIYFWGQSETITVAIEPLPKRILEEHSIHIKGRVDFTHLEETSRMSTIIGEKGEITFKELEKKRPVPVGSEDYVILDDLENFFIKKLHIENGINLIFHGRVGKLATGPEGYVKNRLPSFLEWLYARESWLLYLTVLVSIGTPALAALKRLKIINGAE